MFVQGSDIIGQFVHKPAVQQPPPSHVVPSVTGLQVPLDPGSLQLSQLPAQALSQQTPSAPHTPVAHWSVDEQAPPERTFPTHWPFESQ